MAPEKPTKKAKEPTPSPSHLTAEPGAPKAHFALNVTFPVYAVDWISDSQVLLAGGGGASRTGVSNRLTVYDLDLNARQVTLSTEILLSAEEDAPMTAVYDAASQTIIAGINSTPELLQAGQNDNLRVFQFTPAPLKAKTTSSGEDVNVKEVAPGASIQPLRQTSTSTSTSADEYQRCTALSRAPPPPSTLLSSLPSPSPAVPASGPSTSSAPAFLATGFTSSSFALSAYPSLSTVFSTPSGAYEQGTSVYDVDFNDTGDWVVGVGEKELRVWSTGVAEGKGKQAAAAGVLVQTIERPVLKPTLNCSFRAAKFGRLTTSANLYTIVNSQPSASAPRVRGSKQVDKKAFVSLWDTKKWRLIKTRTVALRPVTAFDISADGTLLAYGSSDLSVGILDAKTLRPILTVLKAHDFPVTALKFNPSGTVLLTASADNTVRVVKVPGASARGAGATTYFNIILFILFLVLAIYLQVGVDEEVWKAWRSAVHL